MVGATGPAGSTVIAISRTELREVAVGWSVKKEFLGKDVYNDAVCATESAAMAATTRPTSTTKMPVLMMLLLFGERPLLTAQVLCHSVAMVSRRPHLRNETLDVSQRAESCVCRTTPRAGSRSAARAPA